jgi:xanthine dehydrogenase accessory factor
MTAREFFERAAELERARTPFVLATVVKREGPISSHVGDRAIVLADGAMIGFVGGSCSRDTVRQEALDAMRRGEARLVQIEGECASEGAVDVYVEPHLPARMLVIAGATPVAAELARLAGALDGYNVVRVVAPSELHAVSSFDSAQDDKVGAAQDDKVGAAQDDKVGAAQDDTGAVIALAALPDFLSGIEPADRERLVAVVASQGHYDEAALKPLLENAEPVYLGLLASRKRAVEVFAETQRLGIAPERLAAVHNPAGIDIGARRPGEVAISILAEIVATLAAAEARAAR